VYSKEVFYFPPLCYSMHMFLCPQGGLVASHWICSPSGLGSSLKGPWWTYFVLGFRLAIYLVPWWETLWAGVTGPVRLVVVTLVVRVVGARYPDVFQKKMFVLVSLLLIGLLYCCRLPASRTPVMLVQQLLRSPTGYG